MQSATDKISDRSSWPADIMEHGGGIIPLILLWGQAAMRLSTSEFIVLLHIISANWGDGDDNLLTKSAIARRMGKEPRTIQRHLTDLEDKRFIKRITKFDKQGWQLGNAFDISGLITTLQMLKPKSESLEFSLFSSEPSVGARHVGRVMFSDLKYSFATRKLTTLSEILIPLTLNDVILLEFFIKNPNVVYSRDVLYDLIRGSSNRKNIRSIDLAIARLRRKLSDGGAHNVIKTVRGQGYKFIASVDIEVDAITK